MNRCRLSGTHRLVLGGLAAAALFAGCSGSSTTPASQRAVATTSAAIGATATPDPRPRPAGVPASAEQVRAAEQFGDPAGPAAPKLFAQTCAGDVITITTTANTVYAELPCDRALPDDNLRPFLGQPLRVRAVIGNPSKLYMESQTGGSVEFTVGRVWVQPVS